MNILNSSDMYIDIKEKEQEFNKKLEILTDFKLWEVENKTYHHLKDFLNVETKKYDKKQSRKNLIGVPNKIKYLDQRLTEIEIEIDLNRIFNNSSFISGHYIEKINKYEDCLKMDARVKDIKRRMKIILLKIYELDYYYVD